MGRVRALTVSVGLVAALAQFGCSNQENAAGRNTAQPNSPSSGPVYTSWPLPAGDYSTIDGKRIWQYVEEQAEISRRYRDQSHPQHWGRIVGTSGDVESAQWLLQKYQEIGLDAHIQDVERFLPQWVPESWEVTATAGGNTVELTSAQPPYGTASTDGRVLDVPVVYVGLGSEADYAGRDVRGKAVLFFRAQLGYNMGSGEVLRRAEQHGAVAILGSDYRGENLNVLSFRANTDLPAFQLGTEDAFTLRDMIANAPAGNPARVSIRFDASWEPDQKSFLVWGTLPGATDETIYVIAHRDGWFEAAGDNASGVATMLGLAEYFAQVPESERRRTMIFIGTDGHHHTPGAYGRWWLQANRERFFSKTALMINAEHTSQVLTHGATNGLTETVIPQAWYAGGSSKPELAKIAVDAFHQFGVPIWAQPSQRPPGGDLLPFYWFVPGLVAQSNDFMYMHTTEDTPDHVAWSGLEATTRAYAKIIDEVNELELSDLQRAPEESTFGAPFDLANCAAWVEDSTVKCEYPTDP